MSGTNVCSSCSADVPVGHRFCGRCGNPMQEGGGPPQSQTAFFGAMQTVGKAKLVLIRGEGMDGVSYHLNTLEHQAGRKVGSILFPEDSYLSPLHANFFYENNRLYVRDEGSLNGIFCRVREPNKLEDGDVFLAGEELLRVELSELESLTVGADQTHFFASPRPAYSMRVTQLLEGGRTGLVHFVRGNAIEIGREMCDINFPDDRFISGRHCRLDFTPEGVTVADLQSRNGTYVKVQGQQELRHGDYLFLGKQLLRVEITTN